MAPRAFVSFEMEDRWARDFLAQHARDARFAIEFVDYSIKEPFPNSWKTNAKARMQQTRGTIVLIGPTTSRSDAVLWEIAETARQGNPLFGIQAYRDHTYTVPAGVAQVVRWDFGAIGRLLDRW